MAEGVFGKALLVVETLRGIHVAVVLGDEIGHVAGKARDRPGPEEGSSTPVVVKVVIGINILEKLAFLDAAHARGGAGRIETMGDFIVRV